ncbi:MAG: 50S ribosomal protein L25 [Deltaproteobacteria bacterium]|nr:50S ribosomal protein L25 [Deltaproteobacteria bacterium]
MIESNLEASLRQDFGKSVSKKLRREGQVPGVIYGLSDPVLVQVNSRTVTRLLHAMHGSARMITLQVAEGGKARNRNVLIKEVQTAVVTRELLHIDFQEVDVNKVVHTAVPIHPIGKPVGERMGGVLQAITHEVQVECLPMLIPEFIEADVSALDLGHTLHVSDLKFPEGVKPLTAQGETLFVLLAPAKMAADVDAMDKAAAMAAETAAAEAAATAAAAGTPAKGAAAAAPAAEAGKEKEKEKK